MVGRDYQWFVDSMGMVTQEEDLDGFGAKVYQGTVRGLSTIVEAIIMFNGAGKMWAAVIDGEVVKYYTTDPDFKNKLPRTIEKWRGLFKEKKVLNMSAPQENPGNSMEPEKVVQKYFEAYIAFLQYDENQRMDKVKQKQIIPNKSLDLNYVTQHFIDSYHKLMLENERTTPPGEVGLLNYDPILCAQDFPENLAKSSFVLMDKNQDAASLRVSLWGKVNEERPVIVRLKKLQRGWRIDSIECLGYNFDSLYQRIKEEQPRLLQK